MAGLQGGSSIFPALGDCAPLPSLQSLTRLAPDFALGIWARPHRTGPSGWDGASHLGNQCTGAGSRRGAESLQPPSVRLPGSRGARGFGSPRGGDSVREGDGGTEPGRPVLRVPVTASRSTGLPVSTHGAAPRDQGRLSGGQHSERSIGRGEGWQKEALCVAWGEPPDGIFSCHPGGAQGTRPLACANVRRVTTAGSVPKRGSGASTMLLFPARFLHLRKKQKGRRGAAAGCEWREPLST